jgi:hypothetical protein
MLLFAIQRRCPWTEQLQKTRCDLLQLKTWIHLRHLGSCLNKESAIRVVKHNRFKGSLQCLAPTSLSQRLQCENAKGDSCTRMHVQTFRTPYTIINEGHQVPAASSPPGGFDLLLGVQTWIRSSMH